jgi:hypothetical protein
MAKLTDSRRAEFRLLRHAHRRETGLAVVLGGWGVLGDCNSTMRPCSPHIPRTRRAEAEYPAVSYPAILARSMRELGRQFGTEVTDDDARGSPVRCRLASISDSHLRSALSIDTNSLSCRTWTATPSLPAIGGWASRSRASLLRRTSALTSQAAQLRCATGRCSPAVSARSAAARRPELVP